MIFTAARYWQPWKIHLVFRCPIRPNFLWRSVPDGAGCTVQAKRRYWGEREVQSPSWSHSYDKQVAEHDGETGSAFVFICWRPPKWQFENSHPSNGNGRHVDHVAVAKKQN